MELQLGSQSLPLMTGQLLTGFSHQADENEVKGDRIQGR